MGERRRRDPEVVYVHATPSLGEMYSQPGPRCRHCLVDNENLDIAESLKRRQPAGTRISIARRKDAGLQLAHGHGRYGRLIWKERIVQ